MEIIEVYEKPSIVFYKGNKRDEMTIPIGAKFTVSPYWFFGEKYTIKIEKNKALIAILRGVDTYYIKGTP